MKNYRGPEKPAPRSFPKTQREVIQGYQDLGIIDENLNPVPPTSPGFVKIEHEDKPRYCGDCGRQIHYATRWNGNRAKLNAHPAAGEEPGFIETAMGHFERAYHHRCPGKPPAPKAKPLKPKPKAAKPKQRKRDPGQGELL